MEFRKKVSYHVLYPSPSNIKITDKNIVISNSKESFNFFFKKSLKTFDFVKCIISLSQIQNMYLYEHKFTETSGVKTLKKKRTVNTCKTVSTRVASPDINVGQSRTIFNTYLHTMF